MSAIVRFNGLASYETWRSVRDRAVKPSQMRISPVRSVNQAVKQYCKARSMGRRLAVDNAIFKLREHKRGTYEKYKVALEWLIQELEFSSPYRLAAKSVPGLFNRDVGKTLSDMAHYAVTDLKSYPGSAKQQHKGRLFNLLSIKTATELGCDGRAGRAVQMGFQRNSMRVAAESLANGRCGCCTTFAARAAHILLTNCPTVRVEIVAVPVKKRKKKQKPGIPTAHCFVVAGRIGTAPGGKLPANSGTWRGNWCTVDPWLAALGYDCVFPHGVDFPQSWLTGAFGAGNQGTGLEQKFDSQGGPINMFRDVQLRATGRDVTQ